MVSKLCKVELLIGVFYGRVLLTVPPSEFFLEDFHCWIVIEVREVDLFQVFMILIVVMLLGKLFDRIEHYLGAESLGEPEDTRGQGW